MYLGPNAAYSRYLFERLIDRDENANIVPRLAESWKNIDDLLPQNSKLTKNSVQSFKAGIFSGSLELVKEGNVIIKQDKLFDVLYIKESK